MALRWRDVDWTAGKIRIRRKRYRGEDGKPKSRRGSRSIPLADRLARELELHFQRSAFYADDDLVFPHPETGNPYDTSKMGPRFENAMNAAGMENRYGRDDGITFHSFRHTFATRCAAAGVPPPTSPCSPSSPARSRGREPCRSPPNSRRNILIGWPPNLPRRPQSTNGCHVVRNTSRPTDSAASS